MVQILKLPSLLPTTIYPTLEDTLLLTCEPDAVLQLTLCLRNWMRDHPLLNHVLILHNWEPRNFKYILPKLKLSCHCAVEDVLPRARHQRLTFPTSERRL